MPEEMPFADFMRSCEAYLTEEGCIVDQPFQPRLPDGMIRCYMGQDKVVGFGHQLIKALIPSPPERPDAPEAQLVPRIMHGPDAEPFQALTQQMESEWVPQMMEVLGIDPTFLPIIWDADFLYGPRDASGQTPMCSVKSTSARFSQSQIRHRPQSRS